MLKFSFYGLVLLIITFIYACGPGGDDSGPLFIRKAVPKNTLTYNKFVDEYTILELNDPGLRQYLSERKDKIMVRIPHLENELTLELFRVDIYDGSGLKVMTDQGEFLYTDQALFYRGEVVGDNNSIVTLSMFPGEVSGVISSEKYGTINIGKTGTGIAYEHMVFNQEEYRDTLKFECGSPDGGLTTPELELLKNVQKLTKKNGTDELGLSCVSVDFEMTYESIAAFGGVTQSVNWMTSVFSAVKQLYAKEGINIVIKSIFVWTTPDGYSTNQATALNQVRAKREKDPAFTGNLVHLVRPMVSGSLGGIAYLGVLCVKAYAAGVSHVQVQYKAPPIYSWTVMVITHEIGHNLGSNHTQWCGWTGGAIDPCYATEGGCPPGPAPVNGGTIMSYCHLTNYGINFNNGFGPQPRAKILSNYNSATCSSCNQEPPPVDLCKNGKLDPGEQGIDCGGNCPTPCPPPPPSGDPLISKGKPIIQSTNYNAANSYPATKVNDGMTGGANFNHTSNELQPFIQIDLGGTFKVSKITVVNRQDCCKERIRKFKLFVSNSPVSGYSTSGYVYEFNSSTPFSTLDIPVSSVAGRYVKFICDNGTVKNYLHLSEISVFGVPGTVVCKDSTIQVTYTAVKDSVIQVCR